MDTPLDTAFRLWADHALSQPLPEGIAAFGFNLYEAPGSFHLELVGCPTYNPCDSAWACTESFAAREPLFFLPRSAQRSTWQQALAIAVQLVGVYLAGPSVQAARLK